MNEAHELTLAAGPIADKQELFALTEDYLEVCYLGTMGAAKTRGLCIGIARDVTDYPGCRIFLCRDELATLKKTTLETLLLVLKQAGLNPDYNKNDAVISVKSGDEVSRVFCFGLNSGDFREKLKSFEPFRIYIDEAHAIGEEKLNFAIFRQGRQEVYHKDSYRTRIEQGIAEGRFKGYEEGMKHFRITGEQLGEHARGRGYVKYVSNDLGNDWIWGRMVNPKGDKPHPDSSNMTPEQFVKWVHENIGVTELFIPPEMGPRLRVGSLVRLKDGRAAEVLRVHPDHALVDSGDAQELILKSEATLVIERLCIYGFSLENQSLSDENVEGFWLADERSRNQYLYGLTDVQTGKMFPMFNAKTHVIAQCAVPESWWVWVGLDYNVDVVSAVFVTENPNGELVIFDEYEGFEGAAAVHASEIINRVDHPWERVRVYYDSSMNERDPLDPSKTVAKIYEQAGLRRMRLANKERGYGAQHMRELLSVNYEPGYAPKPKLWVMDNCQAVIRGTESSAGLMNFTWEDYRHKRKDHMMDALRYALASRSKRRPESEKRPAQKSHARQWLRSA